MNRQNALCFDDCHMKDKHLYNLVSVIPLVIIIKYTASSTEPQNAG